MTTENPSPADQAWGRVGSTPLEQVVEALAFATDEPLPGRRMADIYGEVSGSEPPTERDIDDAVRTLNERYAEEDRPLRIEAWAGGYRMATVAEIAPFIKALFHRDQQRRLTRSLMETLAIIAYRQPVTRPEIEFVRGVDCDYAIRRLLEVGMADVVGRSEAVGRPLLYGTTPKFLDLFGLESLEELPNLREIESILDDPGFHRERAALLMKSGNLAELQAAAASALGTDAADPRTDDGSLPDAGDDDGERPTPDEATP